MSLDATLHVASSGLDSVNRRLALVSHNVANAGTPGYVKQASDTASRVADGRGMGVHTGPARRELDGHLQADLFGAQADAAEADTRAAALAALDAAQGAPGDGTALPDLLEGLREGFSALLRDPASGVQQRGVVSAADGLARGVNALAETVSSQRQAAQDALVADVETLNGALRDLGTLSDRIIEATAAGSSTADLETERDGKMQEVAALTGARFLHRPNGDLLAMAGNTVLPLRGERGAFGMAPVALGPRTAASDVPGLTLGGQDLSARFTEGRIGANLALRDRVLPTVQAELDEFATALAQGFDDQGVRLFTGGDEAASPVAPGTAAERVGFAQALRVNPDVAADPSLVRDGTPAPATPNPAGHSAKIGQVLDTVLGGGAPAVQTAGLGLDGALAARFGAPATLAAFAATLAATNAADAARATARADTTEAVQTALQNKLDQETGVSVDEEMASMIQLQNAYAANARVISTTQAMWQQLLDMVRP